MNVDLLRGVQRAIVQAPDRFCAAQWAFARNADAVLRKGAAPEGFRCCIAGHVLLRAGDHSERDLLRVGGFHTGGELWVDAAHHAGIRPDQGHELFFPSQWDRPYKQQYYLCDSTEEAFLAADYLDHFLNKYDAAASAPVDEATHLDWAHDREASVPSSRSREDRPEVAAKARSTP
jgi:hypothetical protein